MQPTTNPLIATPATHTAETPMPQSPSSSSSSSSSEAGRDYPPLPTDLLFNTMNNVPYYTEAQMRAYVDADRAARATPPSLPIDFKQASELTDEQMFQIIRGTGYVTRGQADEIVELLRAALSKAAPKGEESNHG